MLRASRPSPMWLPGPFRLMGPVRTEFFIGRLSGHNFVYAEPTLFSGTPKPQPYVEGQKISFKPTPNLEFGFSITAMISGPGMPLTLRTVLRSLGPTNGVPGSPNDPGDRRTGFDFTYRIPGLRDRVVLYNDSLADDEFSPIAYPRRSAMNPGIYLPQLPLLPKVDFRAEAVYTNLPGMRPTGFFYTNDRYRSGYTNDGNLIGHWIGREGRAVQLRSTYWHSARTKVQFGYRNGLVDQEFLRGGTYSDFSLGLDIPLRPEIALSSTAQYERWKFPLLRASPQTNGSISVQLTYTPRIGIRR
jgi:hypothetical protein